mmetsp:Transcript_21927/g.39421  ORF Transcript_21927/g.39421 Transcript_21927/m.39421 type:complete len:388 (-) Transcript_21927:21-1184(-)
MGLSPGARWKRAVLLLLLTQVLITALLLSCMYTQPDVAEDCARHESSPVESLKAELKALRQDVVALQAGLEGSLQAVAQQESALRAITAAATGPSQPQTITVNGEVRKSKHDVAIVKFIPDHAREMGALCLDGSPAGYYLRPGHPHKWVILFEGGGWCYNNKTCEERRGRFGFLGSMTYKPKEYYIRQNFGSGDHETNPDFYDWTHVLFVYCDATSFLGNRADHIIVSPTNTHGIKEKKNVFFRGYQILQSNLRHMFDTQGLEKATHVVLSGHSAGAMAVLIHIDQIATRFPATTQVRGLVDAGVFLDYRSGTAHGRTHCEALQHGSTLWNATGYHAECLRQEPQAWRCLFPGYLLKYIKTPLFISQHKYDNWVVKNMLGMPFMGLL